MLAQTLKISKAFQAFQNDAPDHAAAWRKMVGELAEALLSELKALRSLMRGKTPEAEEDLLFILD